MKKSLLKFLSVFFSCVFLFSCSNLIDDDTFTVDSNSLEKVTVTGKISVNGAVPEGIANARSVSCVTCGRTAFPTMPEGSDYYFFKTRDLDSGVEDDAAGYANSDGTYQFSLIIGRRFEVTAGISSDDEHNNVILSTSWETPVVTRENASTLGKNIILEPGTEGTGTVELSMTVDSSIYSVSCNNSSFAIKKISDTEYKVIQLGDYIRCGAYSVTFNFWPAGGNALFSNTQTINVFPNMKTDKWVTGGGSLDPIDASGNYNVTSDLIEKFARTQIYVGSTSWGNASSSGKGSAKDPFDTFQKAVDYIKDNGDATVDYTIWVSGKISGSSEIGDDIGSVNATAPIAHKANSITISGTTSNTKDILNGNGAGTVLTINTTVPVTIRNLKITGGKGWNGGGIYMLQGHLTLENGALIGDDTKTTASSESYGNYSFIDGGGIDISKGTLIMKKGSSVCRNYANNNGGGINCISGEIIMEDNSSVSYNKATVNGGGINLRNGAYDITFTMNGGEINYNEIDSYGGGVSIGQGELGRIIRFDMKGGEIAYNKSTGNNSSYGNGAGGVLIDHSIMTMSGNARIHHNTASCRGGGVRVGSNGTFTMTGGSIYDNESGPTQCFGGGVEVENPATFEMSGSAYIPYGVNGTKGAGKNDVFLTSSGSTLSCIKIAGALTSTAPVATINMETWSQGSSAIVVKADGTNLNDFSAISGIENMFECTRDNYSTVLSSDKKSLYLDAPIFVSKTITKPDATKGSKGNPYDSIASAISSEMNDKNTDYLIYVVGELTEKQTIAGTFKKDNHAKSLTIKGYDDTSVLKGGSDISSPVLSVLSDVPVTIMNLMITGGKSSGIKVGKVEADVTLGNGAKITGNSGDNGGGIYNLGTLKILSGAEISGNTVSGSGGGIYNYFGNIIMEGGSISGNTADSSGGGIYNYKQGSTVVRVTTFEMKGGEVSGNTASYYGGAVYNEGAVKLSGTAYIPAGTDDTNDIFLASGTQILITGSLTPPEEAKGIVATIKPYDYTATLLSADTGVTLANEVGKFRIIPQSSGTSLGTGLEYGLDSTGKYSTDTVMVVPGDNDMDEIKTAIRTLISNSTEPVNLCFTSDFNPVGANSDYAFTISGKTVNITATKPVTLTLNATYHYQQFFKVTGGGKLTLGNNITLKGNNNGLNYAVYLDGSGSELILDGAKITNWHYDGGGAIIYVPSGTVLRIKGNTEIYKNRSIVNVKGGTVYMEGGAIYNNDLENITRAVIIIQGGGKFIKSGGRIYGNKGYRNGLPSKQSQVKFEAYKWYKGGYWGPSEDNLTAYNMEDSGDEDKNKEELYFNSESDVNNQRTSKYSNYN